MTLACIYIHTCSFWWCEGCVYISSVLLPSLGTAIEKECRVIRDFYWRVPVKKMFEKKVQKTTGVLLYDALFL